MGSNSDATKRIKAVEDVLKWSVEAKILNLVDHVWGDRGLLAQVDTLRAHCRQLDERIRELEEKTGGREPLKLINNEELLADKYRAATRQND